MSRKRNHRMKPRPVVLNQMEVAIWASSPHSPEEVARLMNDTDAALVLLLDGKADDKHIKRLGTDINVGWIRVEQLEDKLANTEELQACFERAGAAIEECRRVYAKFGRWVLSGPGRHALQDGVDAFRAVLTASSPREMHHAEQVLSASLKAAERQKATTR